MQIIQLVSGWNSCTSSNQLGPQRFACYQNWHTYSLWISHVQFAQITADAGRAVHCFIRIAGTSLREQIFQCELQKFIFWYFICLEAVYVKWFDLQTVLLIEMSHGLRSKECAGHKSLLIIPSANTPLRASMNALAVQTVVEYCWNNVQQQFFIGQQLGKMVKYLIHVCFRTDCVLKEISLIILSLFVSNYTTVLECCCETSCIYLC